MAVTEPTFGPATLLEGYEGGGLSLGVLGSHSALEVASGAREEGVRTVVVCERGRDATYTQHFRNLFDDVLVLERFADIARGEVVDELRRLRTIFVPNRSFSTYVGYDAIELRFRVPLFGNRWLLRAEERDARPSQADLLRGAGIRTPKVFASPLDIDRLVMVKLPHATRRVERGFFTAGSYPEFAETSERLVGEGRIRGEDLDSAIIEEFVVGAQFNLDYFASPLSGEVEFLGADQRIETTIEGVLRMTAEEQAAVGVVPSLIPVGHRGVTVRESLLDGVFTLGKRLVEETRRVAPPGLIGCFSLQGVFLDSLEFCVFDLSTRVPGAPIVQTTSPYTRYKFGKEMSIGRRIAMEITEAVRSGRLDEVVT